MLDVEPVYREHEFCAAMSVKGDAETRRSFTHLVDTWCSHLHGVSGFSLTDRMAFIRIESFRPRLLPKESLTVGVSPVAYALHRLGVIRGVADDDVRLYACQRKVRQSSPQTRIYICLGAVMFPDHYLPCFRPQGMDMR